MKARTAMSYGSILAMFAACQNSVGAPHPVGHQITTQYHVPHGPGCYLVWAPWLKMGKPYATEKLAALAGVMGIDATGMSLDAAADAAIQACLKLGTDVGMPTRLSQLGVKKESIPQMAVFALDDFKSGKLDPYPHYTVQVMEDIYNQIY
jgi:alcohol dehydrogenase class IV